MDLEKQIALFGSKIFSDVQKKRYSVASSGFWGSLFLRLALKYPKIQRELFRLVDVLPSLNTPKAISTHLKEYLASCCDNKMAVYALSLLDLPLIRHGVSIVAKTAVRTMASQYIAGTSPKKALKALRKLRKRHIAFTVDLLGEYCLSEREAQRYLNRYLEAIDVIGKGVTSWKESEAIVDGNPAESFPASVSIKLSALYSQTSALNHKKSVERLSERLSELVQKASECKVSICIDAEDQATNTVVYEVFKRVFGREGYFEFPLPGIVVQAYAKESYSLASELIEFAKQRGSPISIRLVKGAYWDYEQAIAKQNGWPMPLYSVKEHSDFNFERLTRLLLDNNEYIYPAFASHNIRSLSYACCYAEHKGLGPADFELQLLYGMAEPIADSFVAAGFLVRHYVPIGELIPGMGYLIRRLLENTSNDSFLRHTFFEKDEISSLLRKPHFNTQ